MSLRHALAGLQVRYLKNKIESYSHLYPHDLLSPKNILVCLPPGLRELTLVKQFLPTISYLFKSSHITLLAMPGVRVTDIYPRKGFQILSPATNQLTWTGLPKKSYLNMLKDYDFDMILDLNLEQTVFTSRVLLSFPKAIRIGRGNHLGEPFYNLEIKTKYLRDKRNIYRSLLDTLGKIMNRHIDQASPLGFN